ncbi:fatty-acid oxidation protein subunit alpha [Aphanothece sacrum FPU1]|uniref:Fatty-acid oxidation protein subunit alpha n=1 Tax=Aphanothece sacrum FPU1 TaxID=1920663 RepID=A0A401IE21_APHSA|nr:fatty-acid oxidation protein subunit alpha [Aphanothece sacrum FPU1]GBF83968.1 fatty acid oxidation protein subunit alpha [Aphanothece sacrum FPU3]
MSGRTEFSEEPDRILYLAVPQDIYKTFLCFEPAKTTIDLKLSKKYSSVLNKENSPIEEYDR